MEPENSIETQTKEKERLKALKKYQILDTPADGNFDRITALASTLFNVPIAIISLVDSDRIWFKSHHGLSVCQIDRDPGLCASAILSNDLYIIENAKDDPRSLANPLVAGEFGLRFYAATPLRTEENHHLGTLCIIDKQTRSLTNKEQALLKQLGDIVMDEMNMRLALREAAGEIKKLVADVGKHLKITAGKIKNEGKDDVVSYLEASGIYLQNMQNRLDNI